MLTRVSHFKHRTMSAKADKDSAETRSKLLTITLQSGLKLSDTKNCDKDKSSASQIVQTVCRLGKALRCFSLQRASEVISASLQSW